MPVSSFIESDLSLLYVMVAGYCTIPELLEHEKMVSRDPARRPNMKIVFDIFNADLDVDLNGIKAGVAYIHTVGRSGWELEPTAILTHNRVLETLNQSFELMAHEVVVRNKVFCSLTEALTWLGLSDHRRRVEEIRAQLLREFTLAA